MLKWFQVMISDVNWFRVLKLSFFFWLGALTAGAAILAAANLAFDEAFKGLVYPGIYFENESLSGKSLNEVKDLVSLKNRAFPKKQIIYTLPSNGKAWKITADETGFGYDEEILSQKAFSLGRAANFMENLETKWSLLNHNFYLEPAYRLDENSLQKFLAPLAKEVEKEPREALFRFENGRVKEFRASENGQKLDIAEIVQKSFSLLKNQSKNSSPLVLEMALKIVPPKTTTEDVNNLGLKELLGRGESYFFDSIPERVYNLNLGAQRVNGVIVPPNDIFSFNENIGTISALFGYKKAYSIIQGKTVLDDGAGVCQVSTTLYRAVLNAGLPVLERAAHTYRVPYYEQGGFLPGTDATIYPPSPDLKFKNDTPAYLLVQSSFDEHAKRLTFEIYGTSDSRTTQLDKPVFVSTSSPPPPIYHDDPALLKGIVKQVDTAHPGAKVYFKRKVLRGEEILIDETVWSDYIPWAAVFSRGTMN